MPHSIQLLQAHCLDKMKKRQAALASRRKAEEMARFKSSQSKEKRHFRLGVELSHLGPEHSPGLEEFVKLNNMLKDQPPASFFSSFE